MPQNTNAADERPIPSQAEGEAEPGNTETGIRPVPSQAEGDVETIDQDLAEKSKQRSGPKK
jgi:hypothetical protein